MQQGFEMAELHLQSAISKVISRRNVLNSRKKEIVFSQCNVADVVYKGGVMVRPSRLMPLCRTSRAGVLVLLYRNARRHYV